MASAYKRSSQVAQDGSPDSKTKKCDTIDVMDIQLTEIRNIMEKNVGAAAFLLGLPHPEVISAKKLLTNFSVEFNSWAKNLHHMTTAMERKIAAQASTIAFLRKSSDDASLLEASVEAEASLASQRYLLQLNH